MKLPYMIWKWVYVVFRIQYIISKLNEIFAKKQKKKKKEQSSGCLQSSNVGTVCVLMTVWSAVQEDNGCRGIPHTVASKYSNACVMMSLKGC